jgi:enoyl-CoA hydratase/carnithine racemase
MILTMDDPATRNAIGPDLTGELVAAINSANTDMTVGCIILTGAGSTFCAGGNVKAMYQRTGHFSGNAAQIRRAYIEGVQSIARALNGCEVPVIAAVNGAALGAGLDIAVMCTIRIASETACFAESFIRLGLVSAAGGAWFLSRAIGASAAAELTLTGEVLEAAGALRLGLISRIVPAEELMSVAQQMAAQIVKNPIHSIRLNTRLLRESGRLDLTASLELAAAMQAIVQQTDDQHEAVAAVVEKREAVFKGS